MTPAEVLGQLRYQEEKHRFDSVSTFGLRITDMARDAANTIDELLTRYSWVPVEERLPVEGIHDWVLVRTDILNGAGVPHVAELRGGNWYCDACEGPMEETLDCKVIAWFDMSLLLIDIWQK